MDKRELFDRIAQLNEGDYSDGTNLLVEICQVLVAADFDTLLDAMRVIHYNGMVEAAMQLKAKSKQRNSELARNRALAVRLAMESEK